MCLSKRSYMLTRLVCPASVSVLLVWSGDKRSDFFLSVVF